MDTDLLEREMERLLSIPDEMEKMMHPPARAYVKNAKAFCRTAADIYDRPDSYSFHLDMPGLEASNIKVKVNDGVLHVVGKKTKKGGEEEEMKPIRIERRRRYMRKFTLPEDANEDDVKAVYRDGVLTVAVAKKPQEEAPMPKVVSIPVM